MNWEATAVPFGIVLGGLIAYGLKLWLDWMDKRELERHLLSLGEVREWNGTEWVKWGGLNEKNHSRR